MSDNNTLDYYNQHTADFVNTTQNVDFHEIQELFLSFLPAKAKILDFGCGSGRDTKYFIDNGYEVDAMDYVVKPVEYFSDPSDGFFLLLSYRPWTASEYPSE